MGPVRQNPIQRTVSLFMYVCASHCAQLLHTILHKTGPDSFPSYPPDNHHCSDDVYLREGGGVTVSITTVTVYVTACMRHAEVLQFRCDS